MSRSNIKETTHQSQILVVDDNPQNLQVVGGLLSREGYELAIALSGQEALDYLSSKKTDLILLDIMMPGMDGYEVCRQLQRNPATRDIPVIFLTANSGVDQVAKGFEEGAVDYVTKPFNSTELLARIKTHLELSMTRLALLETNQQLQVTLKQLEIAATTDPLTNLLNRRSMTSLLKDEIVRVQRSGRLFSLVIADIDDFKAFNDNHGHDCGDFVLTSTSALLKKCVRGQDAVARWGGEEFLLFLPETDQEGAVQLAEKLRKKIADTTVLYKGLNLQVTLTFGVASYQEAGFEETIKKSDLALYQGKNKGKNCVVAL